jgi:DGQHR domain-containing protein
MTDYTVQPFKQLHEKTPITLYLGVINAEDLIDGRADIPNYDAEKKTGYQRPPTPSRITSLSRYVLGKGGLLPTAILVNVRNGAQFTPNGAGFGTLRVPEGERLWIMDGQHRYKGLRTAHERRQPLKYDVPVVFTSGFDEDGEMHVFYTVNHEQRSVSTDLTATLFARDIATRLQGGEDTAKDVTPTELRNLAAQRIAEALNEHEGGPWHNRISLASELPDTKTKPIRLKVFSGSLQAFLKDRWAAGQVEICDYRKLVQVVETYWSAVASLMPDAFANHAKYAVQRPLGAYVFNGLLPDIVFRADRAQDWSEGFFKREMSRLEEWVTEDKWRLNGEEPLVSTNSQFAVRAILQALRPTYTDTPGLVG